MVMVLMVVSLAAALAIFRHVEEQPRTEQLAQLVVTVVNLTRAAVLSSAPEWRGALLAELDEAEGLQVQMADDHDKMKLLSLRRPELREMMDKVRQSLGAETRFAAELNGIPALWVSFFIGSEEFWVALPNARTEHPVSQVLLTGGGIVLMLGLLGAYFVAWEVTYPLRRLAIAAKQIGRGRKPKPLPEVGAREVVAVSRSFNQMSADLESNERERALVLAGISHDLRTPLARVRLAAEMISDEFLREGLHADVEQMDEVIQQFLDYARDDEHEAAVETDINALMQRLVQRYQGRVQALTVEVQNAPPLVVRPLLLKRALSNLLDNAIKYGGGDITLGLKQVAEGWLFSVADRGVGIPNDQRESVKRPFVRLNEARSNTTGSGLGLAIVERAAKLHGGQLILAEREGGGLLAQLLLPNSPV